MNERIQVRRIYDPVEPSDGHRVLVDRLWPRGMTRERAQLDDWARELAPSDELRRQFGHHSERFEEFAQCYEAELADRQERLQQLRLLARQGPLTLLHAARNRDQNNAVVLARVLLKGG